MESNQLQKLITDYQKIAMVGAPKFEYIRKTIKNKLNNFVNVIKNENQLNRTSQKTKMLLAYIKSDEVIDMLKSDFTVKDDDDEFKKEVKKILIQNVIRPLCRDLKKKSKTNQDLKDKSAKTSAKKKPKTSFLPNISNISGSFKKLKPNIKMFKKSQKPEEKCEKLKLEILIALVELYENNKLEGLQYFRQLKNIMKPKITSQDDFGTEQVKDALVEKMEDTGINQSVRNMYTKIYEKIVGNL